MTTKHSCSGKAWHNLGNWGEWIPCGRSATVQRNGRCWQHDPIRVEADKKKRRAGWQAEMDREAAKYARIARNARLGALVTPGLAELLEWLANSADCFWGGDATHENVESARALAARIREALGLEGAE